MATPATPPSEAKPLGAFARVLNTFVAPSETFTDLKRDASWWVPFLILVVFSYIFIFAAANKVGWEQIFENRMKMAPKQAEKIEQMPPDQRARVVALQINITKGISYASPIVLLIIYVIIAAVLMATFNFGFGTEVSFKTSLAITVFSRLPAVIKILLATLTLFLGANVENFTFENPLGSNPGYYMGAGSTSPGVLALASSVDVFAIWVIVLTGIGFACVSKVKKGTAIGVVAGWYILITLIGAGVAFAFS